MENFAETIAHRVRSMKEEKYRQLVEEISQRLALTQTKLYYILKNQHLNRN